MKIIFILWKLSVKNKRLWEKNLLDIFYNYFLNHLYVHFNIIISCIITIISIVGWDSKKRGKGEGWIRMTTKIRWSTKVNVVGFLSVKLYYWWQTDGWLIVCPFMAHRWYLLLPITLYRWQFFSHGL